MEKKALSTLSNSELIEAAKHQKTSAITEAVLVGFLIGIVIYSIVSNSLSLLTLIPVYFIYRLVHQPKYDKNALKQELANRQLS